MARESSGSAIPIYLQVADVLRQRIARGAWPQGHCLPSLTELQLEFGVARVTMRRSIELLAREGLLSPQRGRGTFVTGRPSTARSISVVTTLDQLVQLYRETQPKILNIDEGDAVAPLRPADGTPAERYISMRRVHSHHGDAYCVIDIYLDEKIFRKSPRRFRNQTVIPILTAMKDVTIAQAHQVLTIGTADVEVARFLGISVNAPVALVRRVFRDAAGRVIYLGEVCYRGDAIHLDMNLKP